MFREMTGSVVKRIGMIFAVLLIGMEFGFGEEDLEMKCERINGVSMVSINGEIDSTNVLPLTNLGANWAATIPFAFMPSHTAPQLSFDLEWQWKAERIEGTCQSPLRATVVTIVTISIPSTPTSPMLTRASVTPWARLAPLLRPLWCCCKPSRS